MATKLVQALVTGIAVTLIALPVAAATVSVGAGDSLQAAIDNASAGDTILVHAGATFIGNFVVRAGKRSITIRSSAADTNLPGPGQRTGPAYWQYLPKLQSPNTAGALSIEPGASYITIENIEFLPSSNGSSNVIELGYADSRQTSLAVVPQHIVLDRILLNVPEGVPQKRGIALNSGDTTIKNSFLYGLKYDGADAQAICGWNGPGPFVLENNRLVASGENVMFGGSDPRIPYLVPTNIKVLRNDIEKPLSWKGSVWDVKNLFELKNAQDVLIEGNVFAYNWLAAQSGYSIAFTPRNQNGTAPWSVVQRVVFRNNLVRHVSSVFNILGRDNEKPSQLTNDIEIRNNVFEDVSKATYGGDGRMMLIGGGDNIRVRHNTSFNSGTALYAYGQAVTNFVLENNIVNYGYYGIIGDNTAPGNSTLATWFPSAVVLGNVMPNNTQPRTFPTGNSYPPNWAAVGFVDLAGGNYRLASTSAYIAAGTSGSTPGADIDALEAAMVRSAAVVACTVTVTPLSHASPASGDSFSVGVTASASSCSWTVSSDQPWATASTSGGTGSGALMLTVGPNGTSATRTATVSVAGQAVTITEAAPVAAPVCTFTLSPSSVTVSTAGTTFAASLIASDPSCGWSAASNVAWIAVSSAKGTGSASVSITVAATTSNGTRTGTISAGGQTLTVQQFGRKKTALPRRTIGVGLRVSVPRPVLRT